jgi:hypothetical protein
MRFGWTKKKYNTSFTHFVIIIGSSKSYSLLFIDWSIKDMELLEVA